VAAAALYEHYVKLLAQLPTGYAAEQLPVGPPGGEPFSADEVREAVQRLKNNKSLGNQWLSAELLKHRTAEAFYEALAGVVNAALQ